MKTAILVLALSSILVASVKESAAVKCYNCTYFPQMTTVENCKDEFNNAGVQKDDCQYGCFKSKAEKDGIQIVSRGCAPQKMDDGCNTVTAIGVDTDECYCSTDLCNTATMVTTSVTGLVTLVATIIFYMTTY